MAWGRKKKEEAFLKEPVIVDDQQAMAEERSTLNELVDELRSMQFTAFQDQMKKAALENEDLVVSNARDFQNKIELTDHPLIRQQTEDRYHLEDGLYILPEDLPDYSQKINLVTSIFEDYTSADACIAGADEIDPLLKFYIQKFQEALQEGQKLKADLVWQLLKYAVTIVHAKAPNGQTPEENQKIIARRKELIEKTFRVAVMTVDKIYGDLYNLTLEEQSYEDSKCKFDNANQQMESIPQDYQDEMDALSFQGVYDKYPVGHPIRPFVTLAINASIILKDTQLSALYVENARADIIKLRQQLSSLYHEIEKRSNPQNENYDSEEVLRELNRISNATLTEIKDMQHQQLAAYEQSKQLASKIAAVASNIELARAAVDAKERIRQENKLAQKADNFMKEYAKQSEALQKQKETEVNEQLQQEQQDNRILADMG